MAFFIVLITLYGFAIFLSAAYFYEDIYIFYNKKNKARCILISPITAPFLPLYYLIKFLSQVFADAFGKDNEK